MVDNSGTNCVDSELAEPQNGDPLKESSTSYQINPRGLRLSFFRLEPTSDNKVVEELQKNLTARVREKIADDGENEKKNGETAKGEDDHIVFFHVIGHYDILAVHSPKYHNQILFGGSIKGIRSFSSLYCLCEPTPSPREIIDRLRSWQTLAVMTFSLRKDVLAEGGIHNPVIAEVLKGVGIEGIYLNSLTWNEQVLLIRADTLGALVSRYQALLGFLKNKVIDHHSILAVEMKALADPLTATAPVEHFLHLEWLVKLKYAYSFERFFEIIESTARDCGIQIAGNYTRIYRSEVIVVFVDQKKQDGDAPNTSSESGLTWGAIFNFIKNVRERAYPELLSTRLFVLKDWNDGPGKDEIVPSVNGEGAAGPENSVVEGISDDLIDDDTSLLEQIHLSGKECEEIQKKVKDHAIAETIVKALYTLADAANEYPAREAVRSLIPPAVELKKMALRIGEAYVREVEKEVERCFNGAIYMLSAVQKRLGALPPTREFSRVPFEIPLPGMRIFYEGCEFVIESLRSAFDPLLVEKFNKDKIIQGRRSDAIRPGEYILPKCYVHIDTADGPSYGPLAILIPDKMLDIPECFTALSHEFFHVVVESLNIDEITAVSSFVKFSNPRSYPNTEIAKHKLITEICVEVLDFVYSYLCDFNLYMEDEWTFFASNLRRSYLEVTVRDHIVYYLLRTFAVRLWREKYLNGGSSNVPESPLKYDPVSVSLEVPRQLRRCIATHIERAAEISREVPRYMGTGVNIPDEERFPFDQIKVFDLQHDIMEMAPALDDMFDMIWRLVRDGRDYLDRLRAFDNDPESTNIVDLIFRGQVSNCRIEYPHLLPIRVARKVREVKANTEDQRKVSYALILSLWNASKKSNQGNNGVDENI